MRRLQNPIPQRRPLCALPAAVAIVLFLGCGGGGAAMKSPEEGGAPETVPDALADLDRAEAELAQAIGSPAFARPPGEEPRPATGGDAPEVRPDSRDASPTTSPPPPPSTQSAGAERAAEVQSSLPPPDPCVTACRALASMSRSADHLCDLAGHGDDRCSSARSRVERATDRVRSQCPSCR
ncbi:MAG TPA: hypothetical protein VK459_03090 [Polyangiaceae bacterium]|nr:hypothetical protein [Polyangiaceae bacterium]